MTELRELLTQAFGTAASVPAEKKLASGIEGTAYWTFAPNLEVVLADAQRLPAEGQALAAWTKRLNKRAIPLVLIIEAGSEHLLIGPSGNPPPSLRLDARLIVDELEAVRALDPLDVRKRLPLVWQRVRGAGGMTGLRNIGLFSTHYLRSRTPRLAEWPQLAEQGGAARGARSLDARLKVLGFESEERGAGVYVLRTENRPAAAVLSYPPNHDFDRAAAGGELPVAHLLREMERAGTRWGILVSGDVWRLYSAEHPARTTSFAELDLARLGDPAYFAALFSAAALSPAGLAEAIERGSRDFAVGLGNRLRARIYERVVPDIVGAISTELALLGEPPKSRAELEGVYEATLILLYRLLFVLYGESREYLPVDVSEGYKNHSLRRRLDAIVATVDADRQFDETARDIWSDLEETFGAIARGQREWGVPAYNGGLFHDDPSTPAGHILARVRPTNAGLGRALYELAVDSDDDDTGRIDYSDLDIRHLGDMYEGLLSFEADRAREDLAYDASNDAFVPVPESGTVAIPAGTVYLRGRSGGRKASGSYYTPQLVVRHVVAEALVPVHDEHLAEVRQIADGGDEEKAARLLWDFRICDPAMGSGHFLVDALDVLTDRIAAFLAERPLAPVRAVLNQLRETVQAQARELPAGVLEQIRDVDLLKRVVLKRSIYGVDMNPMAVELAKLALWLNAFVPGLPLSYLDHNLRRGNSLVGVVGDEVLASLRPDKATLEGDWIAEQLDAAAEQARLAIERVEFRLEDVDAARDAEQHRREATSVLARVYDRWTAESFGLTGSRAVIAQLDTLEAEAHAREAAVIAKREAFFHWPLEFPEIFQRDRPGFDVVLGNPPWDKVRFEPQQFWVSRFAGLNALSADTRTERIAELRGLFPRDAEAEAAARRAAEDFQRAFNTDYRLQTQHLDYAKLFLERTLSLVRSRRAIGLVLPRQFLVLVGWSRLREAFFAGGHTSIHQLSNRAGWIFPGVENRYMVALVARQATNETPTVSLRGGIDRAELMASNATIKLRWEIEELRERVSDALALPILPTKEDAAIFSKLERHRRLSDVSSSLGGIVSDTPFDWTESSRRSIVHTSGLEEAEYLILQSRHVAMLGLDLRSFPPRAVSRDDAENLLNAKWRGSHTLRDGLSFPPSSALDAVDLYRVVYRYAARSDDSRTLIAALAPRGFLAAKGFAHSAVPLRNDAITQLALLGCLTSLTADWWARRFVDRHVTSGVLRSVPSPTWDEIQTARVAELVAKLACSAGDPLLSALEISGDALVSDEEERIRLRAEIEVAYASSLGLSPKDIELIVGSFNEEGAPIRLRECIADAATAGAPA